MPRETVAHKSQRYLAEGRLQVQSVDSQGISAQCRGSAVYALGFAQGRWFCSCPARGICCHLAALHAVTPVQPMREPERKEAT